MGNFIVVAVLVIIISSIVVHMIRNKKKGKSALGCGCSSCGNCPNSSSCHSK